MAAILIGIIEWPLERAAIEAVPGLAQLGGAPSDLVIDDVTSESLRVPVTADIDSGAVAALPDKHAGYASSCSLIGRVKLPWRQTGSIDVRLTCLESSTCLGSAPGDAKTMSLERQREVSFAAETEYRINALVCGLWRVLFTASGCRPVEIECRIGRDKNPTRLDVILEAYDYVELTIMLTGCAGLDEASQRAVRRSFSMMTPRLGALDGDNSGQMEDASRLTAKFAAHQTYESESTKVWEIRHHWEPDSSVAIVLGGHIIAHKALGFGRTEVSLEISWDQLSRLLGVLEIEVFSRASSTPISDATTVLTDEVGGRWFERSTVDGAVVYKGLSPGNVQVHVRHPRYVTSVSSASIQGGKHTTMRIDLEEPVEMEGIVAASQGVVMPVRVKAVRIREGVMMWSEFHEATVRDDGSFRFTGVAPGEYVLFSRPYMELDDSADIHIRNARMRGGAYVDVQKVSLRHIRLEL